MAFDLTMSGEEDRLFPDFDRFGHHVSLAGWGVDELLDEFSRRVAASAGLQEEGWRAR